MVMRTHYRLTTESLIFWNHLERNREWATAEIEEQTNEATIDQGLLTIRIGGGIQGKETNRNYR